MTPISLVDHRGVVVEGKEGKTERKTDQWAREMRVSWWVVKEEREQTLLGVEVGGEGVEGERGEERG